MIDRLSKSLFLRGLDTLKGGTFQLTAGQTQRFGDPAGDLRAVMHVADDRFFTRALAQGDIGIGESYMDGDWSSPDLVTLIRLMLRNMSHVESRGGLVRLSTAWRDSWPGV